MKATCGMCGATFGITENDCVFYDKISPIFSGRKYPVPPPSLCPDCRMQRRLSFRNQMTAYKRKCDASEKKIVSIYSPDKPYKVYSPEEWWSDSWDALSFGREVDFSRGFFEQFAALMMAVPHIGVLNVNSQNSSFTNQTYNCRHCYLCSAIKDCEDSLYCHNCNRLTTCMDCSFCIDSQLLYQCIDTFDSYNCQYASNCIQCSDSTFLYDCIGCTNCFGCVGLRNKQYHFFNEACTKEQYERKRQAYSLHTLEGIWAARERFVEFQLTKPRFHAWIKNSIASLAWDYARKNIVSSTNSIAKRSTKSLFQSSLLIWS
jgi:hypothetical protein